MTWPPDLPTLRNDLSIPDDETLDDDAYTRRLNAAISFVQRVRKDAFVTDDCGELIEPATYSEQGEREASTLELGTLMLAARLAARRRSPDAILWMADTGTTHVPRGDEDLERMLRIGRHALPRVG